jgi:MFS transporter, ACS family, tartrate transporter
MAVRAANPLDIPIEQRTRRSIIMRVMPYLFLLYIIAFLDRVNVGFAELHMKGALGFSDAVFGFGKGVFFIGYFLLEIPGTLIVERWSARKWIARIMITWGIFAVLMAFVRTEWQFYSVRFLLGLSEAGFFPGIIVYLSHWFRYEDRAKAVAVFMSALPISQLIGAPVSGLILNYMNSAGLAGWQWVFIIEGIPAVILGVVTLFYLTDWPHEAKWLREDEREWITGELQKEREVKRAARPMSVWQAFRQREVVLLLTVYFLAVNGYYGFTLWLPSILQKAGLPTLQVTLVTIIPFFAGLVAMLLVGFSSDKSGERRLHTALPILVAGLGMALAIAAGNNIALVVLCFSLVSIGGHSYLPSFWAMPTAFLTESAAAAAIGLINSVGNLGGFVGPFAVGYISTATGSYAGGMACLAISLFAAGLLALTIRPRKSVAG